MSGSMKYERGFINRSFKVADIKFKYIDTNFKKIRTEKLSLPVRTSNKERISKSFVRQQRDKIIIKILSIEIRSYVYSMSEADFIKYAERRTINE